MVLMIDNYDSFTFNIAQYLIELGENVTVIPNNSDIASVKAMQPTSLVLSPGPCTPSESGISMPMIGEFSGAIPILGICLGHQCIAQFFGGTISQSQDIMHGKTSLIYHTGTGVFANIKNPFRAMRYHSLVLPFDKLPDCLEVTAWTQNPDGTQAEIMGIRHKSLDIEGIQFHPESVLSECGHALLRNFLKPKSPHEQHKSKGIRMDIKQAIDTVVNGQNLSREDMASVMKQIMTGEASGAQIGGFLIGLRIKGESIDEITGAADVMRALATKVDLDCNNVVDTCGTGGDGSNLFNVSTASALVVAAAGGKVAKHGNRSITSSTGSADLLEAAGVNLNISPEQVAKCVHEVGLGFMFAQAHHSAMKHAIGPRKELGLRTIFNVLGPLTNPAGAKRQVVGVFNADLCRVLAEVLGRLGSEHVLVVHSTDGLDEISIAAPTHVAELKGGKVTEYDIHPTELGIDLSDLKGLTVRSAQESLNLIQDALGKQASAEGRKAADMIALNAGAAIYVCGLADSLKEAVALAEDTIQTGLAGEKLKQLAEFTSCFSL